VQCNMKFSDLEGNDRELDAVAFAGGCVFVGEYKNKLDSAAALQLASAIKDIKRVFSRIFFRLFLIILILLMISSHI
jgi:hypothetical protein